MDTAIATISQLLCEGLNETQLGTLHDFMLQLIEFFDTDDRISNKSRRQTNRDAQAKVVSHQQSSIQERLRSRKRRSNLCQSQPRCTPLSTTSSSLTSVADGEIQIVGDDFHQNLTQVDARSAILPSMFNRLDSGLRQWIGAHENWVNTIIQYAPIFTSLELESPFHSFKQYLNNDSLLLKALETSRGKTHDWVKLILTRAGHVHVYHRWSSFEPKQKKQGGGFHHDRFAKSLGLQEGWHINKTIRIGERFSKLGHYGLPLCAVAQQIGRVSEQKFQDFERGLVDLLQCKILSLSRLVENKDTIVASLRDCQQIFDSRVRSQTNGEETCTGAQTSLLVDNYVDTMYPMLDQYCLASINTSQSFFEACYTTHDFNFGNHVDNFITQDPEYDSAGLTYAPAYL